ncbi:hypothetical protein MCOR25_002010 [Pyricularia grisea]|nr:hypothetical protein MCOR25_002010 [Pyricularia grisea]
MDGPTQSNKNMSSEPAEQLLDAFKAAALSVTRLYKNSTAANAKARSDGYQDCLDDLLAFLDKESIGLGDGEGWKIRQWATERLEGGGGDNGGSGAQQSMESEDDADKVDSASSPEMQRSTVLTPTFAPAVAPIVTRTDSAPPTTANSIALPPRTTILTPVASEPMPSYSTTLPTQDTFTFQSTVPYPQEPNLNIESLDLSDARTQEGNGQPPIFPPQQQTSVMSPALAASRTSRGRHGSSTTRPGGRSRLGKGAGQKRRIGDDLADIFNIGSLGYNGKDFFGGSKRSRLN